MEERFDAILIGAGQANGPLARSLAEAGWKVALVEREHVGGTCINEGCTPSKTMIASARVAYMAREGANYGVLTAPVSVDLPKVRQRKRDIVDAFRKSGRRRLEATEGLHLLMGEGRFVDSKSVEVLLSDGSSRHLAADKIFINVGLRPRIPDISGLDDVHYLTSTTIMELEEVPEHLLVLGGGYVGVEFGQMFRRFGAAVTVVQRSDQLLTHEDVDIAGEVADILRQDGIRVLLEAEAIWVEEADGQIVLTVRTTGGERRLAGSHLLLAAGRVPNVEDLDLEAAGIETTERGYISVNERLETNVPGIYALGDVTGGPAFTHIAYDDFRIIRSNLLEHGEGATQPPATTRGRLVPYTVFIDPQLGGIGLTERQARRQGKAVRVAKMPMSHVARALETDEPRGLMKAVVDGDSDQILGAAILGAEGGEVMSALQVAMMGGLPYTALRDAVLAHPTLAESL
ncbi:MAG: mercuric reductase, partial [Anaerolineae bacterium]